jgi:hypothetical protein
MQCMAHDVSSQCRDTLAHAIIMGMHAAVQLHHALCCRVMLCIDQPRQMHSSVQHMLHFAVLPLVLCVLRCRSWWR